MLIIIIIGTTLTDIAQQTFGAGGVGVVLVQLMLVSVAGWLMSYVASAVGNGQVAGMIKAATIFICIALVATTAWKAIEKVAQVLGLI